MQEPHDRAVVAVFLKGEEEPPDGGTGCASKEKVAHLLAETPLLGNEGTALGKSRQSGPRCLEFSARNTARSIATLRYYANTPIAGFPLFPTDIGRPLGVITSSPIGRPAAQPMVAWNPPTVSALSAGS